MMSARQTLDRGSRNTIGDSKNIHRHRAQTIRRRGPARYVADEHHRALRDPSASASATNRSRATPSNPAATRS